MAIDSPEQTSPAPTTQRSEAPSVVLAAPTVRGSEVSALPPQLQKENTSSDTPTTPVLAPAVESSTKAYISGKTTEQIKAEIRESAIRLNEERLKHLKAGNLKKDAQTAVQKTNLLQKVQGIFNGFFPRIGLEMQRDVTAMGVLEEQIALWRESHRGAMPDVTDMEFIRQVTSTNKATRLEGRRAWQGLSSGREMTSEAGMFSLPKEAQNMIKEKVLAPLISQLSSTPPEGRKAVMDHWKQYGIPTGETLAEIFQDFGDSNLAVQAQLEALHLDKGMYASTLAEVAERIVNDQEDHQAGLEALDIQIGYVATQFDNAGAGTNLKDFLRHGLWRPAGRAVDIAAWVLRNGKTAASLGAVAAGFALAAPLGVPVVAIGGAVLAGAGLLAQGIKSFNATRNDRAQMESRMAKGVGYASTKDQLAAKNATTGLGKLNPLNASKLGTRMSREYQQALMAEKAGKHITSADDLYFGPEMKDPQSGEVIPGVSLDELIQSVGGASNMEDTTLQMAINRIAQIKARQQQAAETGRRFISSGEVSELELLAKQVELQKAIEARADSFSDTSAGIARDKIAIEQNKVMATLNADLKSDTGSMIEQYVKRIGLNVAARAGAVGVGIGAARLLGEQALTTVEHSIHLPVLELHSPFDGLNGLGKGIQQKFDEIFHGTTVHREVATNATTTTGEKSVTYDQFVNDHGVKVHTSIDQHVPDNAQYAYGTTDFAKDGGIVVKGYGDIGDRANGIMATVTDSHGVTHNVILEFDKNKELFIKPGDTSANHMVTILRADGTTEQITSSDAAKLLNVTQQGLNNWDKAAPPDVSTDFDYQYGQAVFGEQLKMVSFDKASNGVVNVDILSTVRGHGGINTGTSLFEKVTTTVPGGSQDIITRTDSFFNDPSHRFLAVAAVVGLGTAARVAVDLRRPRYYTNEKTQNAVATGVAGITGGVLAGPLGAAGAMAARQAVIRWRNSSARNAAKINTVESPNPINETDESITTPENGTENDHAAEKEQLAKIDSFLDSATKFNEATTSEERQSAYLAMVNASQELPSSILESPILRNNALYYQNLGILSFLQTSKPELAPLVTKLRENPNYQPTSEEATLLTSARDAFAQDQSQQQAYQSSQQAFEAQLNIMAVRANLAQQEKQRLEATINSSKPSVGNAEEGEATTKSLQAMVAAGDAYRKAKEANDEDGATKALGEFNELLKNSSTTVKDRLNEDPGLVEFQQKIKGESDQIFLDALGKAAEELKANAEDVEAVKGILTAKEEVQIELSPEQENLYNKVEEFEKSDPRREALITRMNEEANLAILAAAERLLQKGQQTQPQQTHEADKVETTVHLSPDEKTKVEEAITVGKAYEELRDDPARQGEKALSGSKFDEAFNSLPKDIQDRIYQDPVYISRQNAITTEKFENALQIAARSLSATLPEIDEARQGHPQTGSKADQLLREAERINREDGNLKKQETYQQHDAKVAALERFLKQPESSAPQMEATESAAAISTRKKLETRQYELADGVNIAEVLSRTELTPLPELIASAQRGIEALKEGKAIVELPHPDVPVIFVGDVHARPDYVMAVISQEITLPDGQKMPLMEAVKQKKAQIIFGGDLLHSEEGVMALERNDSLLSLQTNPTGTILMTPEGQELSNVYLAARRVAALRANNKSDDYIRKDLRQNFHVKDDQLAQKAMELNTDEAYTETLKHLKLPEDASNEQIRKFFLEVELRHTASVMQSIMELKAAYPEYINVLLGTHDQFVYEVQKGQNQSIIFAEMVQTSGYQSFAQKLKEWSEKLPYVITAGNAVYTHTIPGTVDRHDGTQFANLTRQQIERRDPLALEGFTLHRSSENHNRNGQPQVGHLLSELGVPNAKFWLNGHDDQGMQAIGVEEVDGIKRILVDSDRQLAFVQINPGENPKGYVLQRNAGRGLINQVRATKSN